MTSNINKKKIKQEKIMRDFTYTCILYIICA